MKWARPVDRAGSAKRAEFQFMITWDKTAQFIGLNVCQVFLFTFFERTKTFLSVHVFCLLSVDLGTQKERWLLRPMLLVEHDDNELEFGSEKLPDWLLV